MLPPRKDPIPNKYSKSPAMSPPRKDPIPNKYINRIINKQDPILLPILEKHPTVYKPLFNDMRYPNKTKDELNYYIDSSRNDIDVYLNIPNVKKDEDKYDEYKDLNLQALNINKSVINKTEA